MKLASIRVELRKGLARQRYLADNGPWSLAGASGEGALPKAADTPPRQEAATDGKDEGGRLDLSW